MDQTALNATGYHHQELPVKWNSMQQLRWTVAFSGLTSSSRNWQSHKNDLFRSRHPCGATFWIGSIFFFIWTIKSIIFFKYFLSIPFYVYVKGSIDARVLNVWVFIKKKMCKLEKSNGNKKTILTIYSFCGVFFYLNCAHISMLYDYLFGCIWWRFLGKWTIRATLNIITKSDQAEPSLKLRIIYTFFFF